ncbi:MAG TPA: hypothetical protein VJH63_01660 [Candidatus Paceibacterota bacterium]
MKKIYAVTHGRKLLGINPRLDPAGEVEIAALASRVPTSESMVDIVVGTGARFVHTFDILARAKSLKIALAGVQVKYSPILGSADSGKKAETGWDVILADGTEVKAGGYLGLIDAPGIDLWKFLEEGISDGTLLITGREFIGALVGSADNAKSAAVYEITINDKEFKVAEIK